MKNSNRAETIEEKVHRLKENHANKQRIFISFSLAVVLGMVSVTIGELLNLGIGNNSYFLLCFPAIALSTWYGDEKTGGLTALITTFGLYVSNFYYIRHAHLTFPQLILYIVFFIAGMIVCYFVEKSKGHEKVSTYRKREKEYIDLISEIQNKYAKAQAEIKSRDEFLSIASHELKTPVTSMLLQLQTALHNIRNVSLAQFSVENLLKMLDSCEQQSKRIAKMINDLLNVSLISTGRIDLEKEYVDLAVLVKNVCDQFAEKIKTDGYNVKYKNKTPVLGMFDKLRIEQVVTNLLTNAMRYGEKKPIEIIVEKHGKNGAIRVQDHGIGIPAEQREKIFNRFERGANGQKIEGLGVGLYISNQIVKAHGGKISIESEEGEGSTFTVSLPLERPQKEQVTNKQ